MRHLPLTALLLASTLATLSPLTSAATSPDPDDFTPPTILLPTFPTKTLEAKDLGATGDGKTNDTPAINKAIDALASAGGGSLHFSAGTYLAASIHLQSNIQFLLDDDAVIEGAPSGYDKPEPNEFSKFQDEGHSHFHNALMWGEKIENFAIIGGVVTGGPIIQGTPKPGADMGDKLIAIAVGKNLLFKNVTHNTCGHFAYLLNDCENITIDHVTTKKSRDVIDLMGCRNVAVHDCHFTGAGDDTLGIKSDYALGRRIQTENIYAWDDYFESGCNGLQFGSETAGDFKHVRCWNIKIGLAMKAGIGITCNDSANISDVRYKNIQITKAANPIYILITDRLRTGEKPVHPGSIKDIHIEDVTISDMQAGRQGTVNPVSITALPDYPIENVTLKNIQINYPGGGAAADASIVPPYPKDYSPRSLGPRPASAFFLRHIRGLTLDNVQITFDKPDARPPFVAVDVQNLILNNVQIANQPATPSMIRLDNSPAPQIAP